MIGKIEKFTPRGFKEGSPYLYLPFPTGNTRLAALSLTALPTKENIQPSIPEGERKLLRIWVEAATLEKEFRRGRLLPGGRKRA